MPTVDDLLEQFGRQASLAWSPDTARDHRVWILHYDRLLEQRVQGRLHEFEALARKHGHGWASLDLAALVAPRFASHDLFVGLVEQPEELPGLLPEFEAHVVATVRARLRTLCEHDVLVLSGAGALFGLTRASTLTEKVAPDIRGRLLLLSSTSPRQPRSAKASGLPSRTCMAEQGNSSAIAVRENTNSPFNSDPSMTERAERILASRSYPPCARRC